MITRGAALVKGIGDDRWEITVQIYGSAFDGMTGNLHQIDRIASDAELTRRRTNAVTGAFAGARIAVATFESAGPTNVLVRDRYETGRTLDPGAPTLDEVTARVRRLLNDVYQSMDWFVQAQPQSAPAPAPIHTAIANPGGIARATSGPQPAPSYRRPGAGTK